MTTTEPQSVAIVSMETDNAIHDNGRDFPKSQPPQRRYRYHINVVYIGDDGSRHSGIVRGLTKPKLKGDLERMTRYIAHGMLRYEQHNGQWRQMINFTPHIER